MGLPEPSCCPHLHTLASPPRTAPQPPAAHPPPAPPPETPGRRLPFLQPPEPHCPGQERAPAMGAPLCLAGPAGPGSGLSRVWRPALTPWPSSYTRLSQTHSIGDRVLTSHTCPHGLPHGTQPCHPRVYRRLTHRHADVDVPCRTSRVHALTHTHAFAHMEK